MLAQLSCLRDAQKIKGLAWAAVVEITHLRSISAIGAAFWPSPAQARSSPRIVAAALRDRRGAFLPPTGIVIYAALRAAYAPKISEARRLSRHAAMLAAIGGYVMASLKARR